MTQEPTMAPTTGAGARRLSLNDKAAADSVVLEEAGAGGHGIYDHFYSYAASAFAQTRPTDTANTDPARKLTESNNRAGPPRHWVKLMNLLFILLSSPCMARMM